MNQTGVCGTDSPRQARRNTESLIAGMVPRRMVDRRAGTPETLTRAYASAHGAIDSTATPEARSRGVQAREEMANYFAELVRIRRDQPRDDLISELVAVQQRTIV